MANHSAIRLAAIGDEEALALLGSATFLEAFADVLHRPDLLAHCRNEHSEAKYRHWLANAGRSAVLLAEEAFGSPIGYAVLAAPDLQLPGLDSSKDIELKRIYVLHRFHGTGIGAALMTASVTEARLRGKGRLLLWVYEQNPRALKFYAKSGFKLLCEQSIQVGDTRYRGYVYGLDL